MPIWPRSITLFASLSSVFSPLSSVFWRISALSWVRQLWKCAITWSNSRLSMGNIVHQPQSWHVSPPWKASAFLLQGCRWQLAQMGYLSGLTEHLRCTVGLASWWTTTTTSFPLKSSIKAVVIGVCLGFSANVWPSVEDFLPEMSAGSDTMPPEMRGIIRSQPVSSPALLASVSAHSWTRPRHALSWKQGHCQARTEVTHFLTGRGLRDGTGQPVTLLYCLSKHSSSWKPPAVKGQEFLILHHSDCDVFIDWTHLNTPIKSLF